MLGITAIEMLLRCDKAFEKCLNRETLFLFVLEKSSKSYWHSV